MEETPAWMYAYKLKLPKEIQDKIVEEVRIREEIEEMIESFCTQVAWNRYYNDLELQQDSEEYRKMKKELYEELAKVELIDWEQGQKESIKKYKKSSWKSRIKKIF